MSGICWWTVLLAPSHLLPLPHLSLSFNLSFQTDTLSLSSSLNPSLLSPHFLPPFLSNCPLSLSSSLWTIFLCSLHPNYLLFTLNSFTWKRQSTAQYVQYVMYDKNQIPTAYQHSLTFPWVWISPLRPPFFPQNPSPTYSSLLLLKF